MIACKLASNPVSRLPSLPLSRPPRAPPAAEDQSKDHHGGYMMPHWMHSEPMNTETFTEKGEEEMKVNKTRSDCAMKILAALIFGGGCGALGAFVVLFVFSIFRNRRPVTPEDLAIQPKKLEHKKLGCAIHKAIQDGKK